MGRKPSAAGEASGALPPEICPGCHERVDTALAVRHIAVEAPELLHLNGVYHPACAQPVVMLLSVLGLLNAPRDFELPEAAPPKIPPHARRH